MAKEATYDITLSGFETRDIRSQGFGSARISSPVTTTLRFSESGVLLQVEGTNVAFSEEHVIRSFYARMINEDSKEMSWKDVKKLALEGNDYMYYPAISLDIFPTFDNFHSVVMVKANPPELTDAEESIRKLWKIRPESTYALGLDVSQIAARFDNFIDLLEALTKAEELYNLGMCTYSMKVSLGNMRSSSIENLENIWERSRVTIPLQKFLGKYRMDNGLEVTAEVVYRDAIRVTDMEEVQRRAAKNIRVGLREDIDSEDVSIIVINEEEL
jgi:hypothetical protein